MKNQFFGLNEPRFTCLVDTVMQTSHISISAAAQTAVFKMLQNIYKMSP